MKVSVIIPTFNREKYIGDAIESVLSQNIDGCELIVVDDGSTDNTQNVIQKYIADIKYIRHNNQGIAKTRNVGMLAAQGEYIAYLDDDDIYYPYKLKLQTTILDNMPQIGMIYSDFSAFDDYGYFDEFHIQEYHESAYRRGNITFNNLFTNKESIVSNPKYNQLNKIIPKYFNKANLYYGDIYNAYLMNTVVFVNSMMFRRELLLKTGLQRNRFGLFHDLEFALRICKATPVAYIDIPTYKLRYHPNQVSTLRNPIGGLVNIRKQRDLLLVTKYHTKFNKSYYRNNKVSVDMQLAKLCKAVAIPLLSNQTGSKSADKKCSKHARKYLSECIIYGKKEYLLLFMTYMPHLVRRTYFKLISLARKKRPS